MNPLVAPPAPTLAAALPPHPGLGESLVFQLNGLVVVFLALASIWAVLEATGVYFRRAAARARKEPPPAPAPSPVVSGVPAGLPPETIAAITAAVSVVIDRRHRISAIVPLAPELDWAHEGRRQIFASHQVR
jgi:hypothetical protein